MPFPSSEVFRCLPCRKEILDGMLGANLKPTPATSLPPAYTDTHANQPPRKHPT
ncbi:hypothetical protein EDB19DRAFT_1748273 [Suillus lakei]|nr:hypothetical protein EDB19DRAFT_1748273 [Suillus lakei]